MICPICGNEMAIAASRTCVDRDDRPDLATRVWVEQDLCCRNRSCSGWGRVQRRARTFLIGEAEAGEELNRAADKFSSVWPDGDGIRSGAKRHRPCPPATW